MVCYFDTDLTGLMGASENLDQSARNASSRVNVLGGPRPARLMGPLSSLWTTWRGGSRSTLYQRIRKYTFRSQSGSDMISNYDLLNGACFNRPKCMKTGGTCTLHKRLHSRATHLWRLKFNPSISPSLTICLNSNPGTNVLCVLCRTCV